ncbi:MAG TPA: class I SAM-dependent methyltransferase [Capillimicrobium sp.]|jgi:SAM-dependent methyltransferase
MHPQAAAFSGVADAYERGRPGYPSSLAGLLGLAAGVEVLDLGAGTGKLTRALAASGATVTAVEPLEQLRSRIGAEAATVLDGTAEAIPLADASVDVVAVGEAWHWFDHARAADELARVLRPAGTVGLVWQEADPEHLPAWTAEVEAVLAPLQAGHPAFGPDDAGRPVLDAHPAFDGLRRHRLEHVHETDHEGVIAVIASFSYVAALEGHERQSLLGRLASIVPPGPLRLPYLTDVWLTRRRA